MNFNIFGGFQKNAYSLGYGDFVDTFLGHLQIGLYIGVISMHLGSFLKVKVQNGGICLGCQNLNIFGVLEIPDIFSGER